MEKSYKIAIYLLVTLGLLHCSGTFFFYKTISLDSLWFFGTGMAFILLGLFNLSPNSFKSGIFNLQILVNFVFTLYTFAITYVLKEPQAYVALVLVIFIFVVSVFTKIKTEK